jgi:hypothetical protein
LAPDFAAIGFLAPDFAASFGLPSAGLASLDFGLSEGSASAKTVSSSSSSDSEMCTCAVIGLPFLSNFPPGELELLLLLVVRLPSDELLHVLDGV